MGVALVSPGYNATLYLDPRQNGFRKHLARSPEAVIRHWSIELKRHSMVLLLCPDLTRCIQYGKRGSWR